MSAWPMQRALDKTEQIRRAPTACGDLEAAGGFEDLSNLASTPARTTSTGSCASSSSSEVDTELAKMKAELGVGSAAPAGELGTGAPAGTGAPGGDGREPARAAGAAAGPAEGQAS